MISGKDFGEPVSLLGKPAGSHISYSSSRSLRLALQLETMI
ncbi:hypothetical protein ABER02_04905 [Rossellomorea marisflavi]|nr:hypothetical protein [Rossellomorea marisflavi]